MTDEQITQWQEAIKNTYMLTVIPRVGAERGATLLLEIDALIALARKGLASSVERRDVLEAGVALLPELGTRLGRFQNSMERNKSVWTFHELAACQDNINETATIIAALEAIRELSAASPSKEKHDD